MRAGRPDCATCSGAGYLVRPSPDGATATACDCVPACGKCGGSGRLLVTREGVRRMARCTCQMLPDRVALFNAAGIPARHADSTFESFRRLDGSYEAKQRTEGWSYTFQRKQSQKGLVLFGPVGRGKTHLMVAAVRTLVFIHGVRARFVEFSHLLSELKRGFETGGNAARMSAFDNVDVLAIDELGKGRATEWERTILDELISRAYNDLRTVLATSNFAPGKATGVTRGNQADPRSIPRLVDRVGDRVDSRLQQMAEFCPVMGPDMRAQ